MDMHLPMVRPQPDLCDISNDMIGEHILLSKGLKLTTLDPPIHTMDNDMQALFDK